jgi:hypothetical protein
MFIRHSIFCLAILCTTVSFAQGQPSKVKKQKTYTKTYPLSANEKVTLDNQFGELRIQTWNKNEILVKVDVTVQAHDEDAAEDLLKRITITDGRDKEGVAFKTTIAKVEKKGKVNEKNSQEIKINYQVFLPQQQPLVARNQFGPIILPDYRGLLKLDSQFGEVNAGYLSNVESIKLKFGSAQIAKITKGDINSEFSTLAIDEVAGDLRGNLQNTTTLLGLGTKLKKLQLKTSYSEVNLNLNKGLDAQYDLYLNHAQLKNKSSLTFSQTDAKKSNTSTYAGKWGSGGNEISLQVSFGSVTAGHGLKLPSKKSSSTTILTF